MRLRSSDAIRIPRSPDDVSVDWLNDSLTAFGRTPRRLVDFEMTEPPQGQSSVTRKIEVTWDGGRKGALFLKMLDPDAPFVDLHRDMGVYRTEVGFYTNVLDAGMRVPECYVAEVDPETQAFVLLLEDVGPGRSLASMADAELAIVNLARLHGRWWGDETLPEQGWLGSAPDRCLRLTQDAQRVLASLEETPELGPLLAPEAREALTLLLEAPMAWAENRQRASPTLCHGDYHPGQMFFPTERNGFVVFDWQFALYGSGVVDLVFFLATTLTESQYRQHGERLVARYCGVLGESVHDYRRAELATDLGHAAMFVLMARLMAFLSPGLEDAKAAHAARGVDWRERITYPSRLVTELGGLDAVRSVLG